jgi:O-antigen/teichoic acid export membrane protein
MPSEHLLETAKKQIIKDSSKFITSTYLGNIIGIITGILIRRFLEPTLMGIWSYLQVIQYYANYSEVGVLSAVERELPYYYGKEDKQKADKIKNSAFAFTTIISFIVFSALVVYAFANRRTITTPFFYGILTIAILASAGQYGLFYTVLLRADKNIPILSKAKIFFAIIWLLLILALVIPFNIYGLYVSAVILMFGNIIYFYYGAKYRYRLDLDFAELKRLSVIGLPIVILAVGVISIKNIDRIFIANMLGAKHLGYYSIAIMASNYIFTIPSTFSIVMFPRFQESYALKNDIVDIQNFVDTPTRILAYFIAIFIGFAFLILPPVVITILPQYTEGITALKLLLLGTFFISLTHMSNQFLITLNKQLNVVPLVFLVVVIGCFLDYSFIKWGFGINGVAIATGISYFLYYFTSLGYAMLHYANKKTCLKFIVGNLFPICTVLAFLLVIDNVFPLQDDSLFLLVRLTVIRLSLFTILCIPLLWHVNRNTRILNRIFRLLGEKFLRHSEP